MGLPHVLQNAVAKLRAWGRSKRTTDASPRSHRNAEALTITSQECAVPVAFRQREQWQFRKRSNGPSTSNATSPHMQLPRNVVILVSSPGSALHNVSCLPVYRGLQAAAACGQSLCFHATIRSRIVRRPWQAVNVSRTNCETGGSGGEGADRGYEEGRAGAYW